MTDVEAYRMNPDRIVPPHEVMDEDYAEQLTESMRTVGWQGAPIVIVDREGADPLAVTGSHRIPAARAAGISVPVAELADILAAHGLDLDEIIVGTDAYDMDEDLAIFQAAFRGAERLPSEVVDFYGLDLHG